MPPESPPEYKVYRARPRLFGRRIRGDGAGIGGLRPGADDGASGRRRRLPRRLTPGRLIAYLVAALVAWGVLSLLVFLVSAQIQQGKVSDAADRSLGGGGTPPFGATTILVLGSDQRSAATAEPGASTKGPSRSDSILLLRVGGGANSRLSIARDTIVDIPGAGRQKINAAYAIGGAALAVVTIEQYLEVDVNHLIEVSFADFPELIDAMGGIDYKGGCVVSKVNGGYANGGVTVRIRSGEEKRLNGDQALALARTRKNTCNPRENDLTRARRQQRIVGAMRSRALSPSGYLRGPFIAWQSPKTFRTDMSGPTLMGVFGAMGVAGDPETRVLGTADGNVPEARRDALVRRFLDG